jgi:hypothetical protein
MEINNTMDLIDSRDLVERYNEIVGIPEFFEEEISLEKVIRQGEKSSEWDHGEIMIHENYFVQFTKDLIDECWDIAGFINNGGSKWPYNHVKIDYESAAKELMNDYTIIDFDGETYYVRA